MSDIVTNIICHTNETECPICFSIIGDTESYYILECCNKIVHLQCLIEWYSTYSKYSICFMCNQPNNLHNNLHKNLLSINNQILDNSENISNNSDIENHLNNYSRDNLSILILNNNNNNKYLEYCYTIVIILIIVIVICSTSNISN